MAKAIDVLHVLNEKNNADDRGSKSKNVSIDEGPCGCRSKLSSMRPDSCISCMRSKMFSKLNKKRKKHKKNLNSSNQQKISCCKKKNGEFFLSFGRFDFEIILKIKFFLKHCLNKLFFLIFFFQTSFGGITLLLFLNFSFFSNRSENSDNDCDSFNFFFRFRISFCSSMAFFIISEEKKDIFSKSSASENKKIDFGSYRDTILHIFDENDSDPPTVKKKRRDVFFVIFQRRDLINRELAGVLRNFFYFGTQNAFCFNGESVIDFFDIYEKMCSAHDVSEKDKIKRLHRYCTFAIDQYIRNIFIEKDLN